MVLPGAVEGDGGGTGCPRRWPQLLRDARAGRRGDPQRGRLSRSDREREAGDHRRLHARLGADGEARSEEHTSELQSLMRISYAVFSLTQTNTKQTYPPRL